MSRASYIIICDGRIDLAIAKNGFEMIRAASRTATNLVTYYGEQVTNADTKPISDLQHQMMDVVSGTQTPGSHAKDFQSASDMCDTMFVLLEALEKKIGS